MTLPKDDLWGVGRTDSAGGGGSPARPGFDPEEQVSRLDPDDPSGIDDPEEQTSRLDPDDPSGGKGGTRAGNRAGTRAETRVTTSARSERFERREVLRPSVPEECYSGFIIVRLADKLARRDEGCDEQRRSQGWSRKKKQPAPSDDQPFPRLWEKFPDLCGDPPPGQPDEGTGEGCPEDPALACLKALVRECPPRRLVRVLGPEALGAVEELAVRLGAALLHRLASYWRIDARHLPERLVRAIVRLLNEFPEVDLAYRELAALDPADARPTPSFAELQQYCEPAPLGIGARWAWKRASELRAGGAASVVVADLEQGWLEHEDMAGGAEPVHGTNRHGRADYRGDHGTAVLGQLAASANGRGVVGIVPDFEVIRLSHFQDAGAEAPSNGHVADAVVAALLELTFEAGIARRLRDGDAADLRLSRGDLKSRGDVLLVEVQRSFKPAEVDHADFDAVRLATALGVIVVEAAGNGAADLDAYRDETGARILATRDPGFRDSGAVLVGAAEPALPHNRSRSSNFGSRLDCFAWGDGVVTCGYGDLFDGGAGGDGKRRTYTRSFKGTSAAAPIVAGAAALLQWMSEAGGGRLTPSEMRRALSNRATGTPQGRRVAGAIGVMPDLRAIVQSLGLEPVFLAEEEEADGAARLSAPHVKVTPGSPGASLELTNQGLPWAKRAGRAANLEVDLYRSELSTLTTPDMWRKVETTLSFNEDFPAGMPVELPVDGKTLPAAKEARGFLALPRRPGELATVLPPGPPYFDWDSFVLFLRRHRSSVTNVQKIGGRPPKELELPFLVSGAPDGPRVFDFEILQRLPMGTEVSLEVPVSLEAELGEGPLRRHGDRFILPARPRVSLPGVRLAAAGPWADPARRSTGRYSCVLRVHGPRAGFGVTVRQLYRGEELGRIHWES